MKIFSHRLTRTDGNHRLAVRRRAPRHLPRFRGRQRAQSLIVKDEKAKEWVFLFKIRKGRHKKPKLSTSWLDFVRSKKLRIGDEIHFFKEEDEATGARRYTIKAMTEFTLFGHAIFVPYADEADR